VRPTKAAAQSSDYPTGKSDMTGKTFLLSSAIAVFGAFAAHAETELTVYTAFEAEFLERYAAAFNAEHPDIKVNWVRDSTGVSRRNCWPKRTTPALMWSGAWLRPRFSC
jgi:iron(III) transport system substrate-binding protein